MVGLANHLGGIRDWETELPFLDLFKFSRLWAGVGATKSFDDMVEDGDINSDGWPIRIPVGSTSVQTIWAWSGNDPTINPDMAGDYVLTFEGAGTFTLTAPGATLTVTHTSAGRREFTYSGEASMFLDITETDPEEEGDFLRNFKLFKAENESRIDANEVFNPRFLSILEGSVYIRFMEAMETNTADEGEGEWAARGKVADAQYRRAGWPIEHVVSLCNLLDCGLYVCMKHLSTDEYIEEMATYVRDNLNADLTAYFEWSNEIWNFGFRQTDWLFEEAGRVWGTYTATLSSTTTAPPDPGEVRLNHATLASVTTIYLSETDALAANIAAKIANTAGGVIRLTDGVNTVEYLGTANPVDNGSYRSVTVSHRSGSSLSAGPITVTFIYGGSVWMHYAGKKATQMAVIIDDVYAGEPERRVLVAGTHTSNTARTTALLNPTSWQTYEPGEYVDPTTVFDAIAVTTYFGSTVMTNATLRNNLLADIALSYQGAMDNMKTNLLTLGYSSQSIPAVAALWVAHRNLSVASGMRFILYEGGQHIHHDPGGISAPDLAILQPWLTDFCASEQMAELYGELWDAWEAFTGEDEEPFMQFVTVGQNDQAGSWCLRTGLADPGVPRTKLVEARRRGMPYRANCVPATLRDD